MNVVLIKSSSRQALMFRSGSVSPKKSILKKKSFPEGDEHQQHQQETVHSADFYPGPAPSSPYLELMGPQVNEIFDLFAVSFVLPIVNGEVL